MVHRENTLLDKTLLRYVWSFLLVLLLPSGILFLVYNQYFFSRYQKEVLERYQTEINNLDMEIVTHVQWMRTIAGQLANLQTCQYDNIREDAPNYSGIINTFISIVSPQKFFSSVGFYSDSFPNTIFTNHGTYNLQYYKRYGGAGEEFKDLKDMTENLAREKWFTPGQVRTSAGDEGNYCDFVLPVPHSTRIMWFLPFPSRVSGGLARMQSLLYWTRMAVCFMPAFRSRNPFGRQWWILRACPAALGMAGCYSASGHWRQGCMWGFCSRRKGFCSLYGISSGYFC